MLIPFGVFSAAGAGGAAVATDYELIQTFSVGTATAQVDLDVSSFTSTYKHLQVRLTARTSRGATNDSLMFRLNTSSSSIYDIHLLYGEGGGTTTSAAGTNVSFGYISDFIPASSATADNFGVGIIDFIDAFSTTKNKTVKALSGTTVNSNGVVLSSTNFRSTSAITAVRFFSNTGANIEVGSRFSIYGWKG